MTAPSARSGEGLDVPTASKKATRVKLDAISDAMAVRLFRSALRSVRESGHKISFTLHPPRKPKKAQP